MVGISFAIEDGPSYYLPFGHSENNLPKHHVLAYIKDNAALFAGDLVGANLQYDLDYLEESGVVFPKVKRFRDIQIAEPLIDELQNSYSMENISKRHGLPGKDETLLRDVAALYKLDPKKDLHKIPARYVGPYAVQDAILPLTLLRRQERIIEDQDLGKVYDLECRLLPALLAMRRRGVRIDLQRLQQIEDWTWVEQAKELALIKELTGYLLSHDDINKTEALLKPLRTIANLKLSATATGKDQVDKDLLKRLKHPVASAILRAKKLSTLRNTFISGIRSHITNGRIHCSFNQLRASGESEDGSEKGVRYGRMSASDPNLQNQPARDEEMCVLGDTVMKLGPMWRTIYLPEEGMQWAACDYSGQEPRMLVHYANISGCKGAKEMAARYHADPELNFHKENAKLTGVNYADAKTIGLGLCYGMGGAKLARSLNLPTEWIMSRRLAKMVEIAGHEAQEILNRFDAGVPFLRQLQKICQARAEKRGYLIAIDGRHCRFPLVNGKFQWAHKATNRLIQGSSAGQTKLAVALCHEASLPLQLQVHDEVDLSTDTEAKSAQETATIMRECVPLTVPSKVDVELGRSWGDSMKK
jgi:DNA polymerase I-like protein with 3'-5' exonuclease and polymerase domains